MTESLVDGVTSNEQYDIILYATGYDRSHWVDLLKHSEIGGHFGLDTKTSAVQLVPVHERVAAPRPVRISQHSAPESLSPTSSAESTPPSSPEPEIFSSMELGRISQREVYITRNYRLLPSGHGKGVDEQIFQPRIYVQGVEEATHGLSDTLLSVLGIRAGEVVADLMGA